MIIVCSTDQAIQDWADIASDTWGEVQVLNAPADLANVLGTLPANEELCLCAHGNDGNIGDENAGGWDWSCADIANLLQGVPMSMLFIAACAKNVSNFSAGVAIELEALGVQDGLWCYGYNTPVSTGTAIPDPGQLSNVVDVQGSQVKL
jgi:hypothetical protein